MSFPGRRGTSFEGKICNFMIDFPPGFPFYPPDIYCIDKSDHSFLHEGNRIPFFFLDDSSWSQNYPLTLFITGIYRLFMINRLQALQQESKERKHRIYIPICAIDMYTDVIDKQNNSNSTPRAAWASFRSKEMTELRHKSQINKFNCLCEICQIDKEIEEHEAKKNAVFAAIIECKKMIQENNILAVTD
ncbi:unnamed protein product [Oikopleura dioica]|uniref:UBC core domain-containing protein n=1 Tax=Oikopleura dioica TaxID=34765 RepID=E4Y9Q9_OIKDI|nr:unnamed protein product [Oikopleura dioica]